MIRKAKHSEANILTNISFASKRYWNYPEQYFEIWKEELTITPDYIQNNDVFVYTVPNNLIGYYALQTITKDIQLPFCTIEKGTWLEHLFILPSEIKKGFGSALFNHAIDHCRQNQINTLRILADPNSRGFYEKMDCKFISEFPSTIKDRTTPYLHYTLKPTTS